MVVDGRQIIRSRSKYVNSQEGLHYLKVIDGFANFAGYRKIEVEGVQYEGLKIIIATRASTFIPSIKGLNSVLALCQDSCVCKCAKMCDGLLLTSVE